MGPVEIILIILGSILVIYLALVTVDLSFFFSFNTYFKKHKKGLEVVLNMKLENLKRIVDIFKTNKISVSPELKQKLDSINPTIFGDIESDECKQARESLSFIRDELFFTATKNEHILVNEEYLLAKENILEQDIVFRKYLAMYNADVLGYNYWSNFKPARYIFLIFKVKEKEIIWYEKETSNSMYHGWLWN